MRKIKPFSKLKSLFFPMRPISNVFGFDRGTPIDRYYIDEFPSITNDYNCFCDIEELNYNDFMKLISGRTTAISSDYKEIIY